MEGRRAAKDIRKDAPASGDWSWALDVTPGVDTGTTHARPVRSLERKGLPARSFAHLDGVPLASLSPDAVDEVFDDMAACLASDGFLEITHGDPCGCHAVRSACRDLVEAPLFVATPEGLVHVVWPCRVEVG
jgi:hypothetical protein